VDGELTRISTFIQIFQNTSIESWSKQY